MYPAPSSLRDPDRRDQNVGARTDRRKVRGPRVTDGNRRVARQQQRRDGFADEIRAADDDHLGALDRNLVAVEQLDHAERRAWSQPRCPLTEPARADRRQSIDVLLRRDQRGQRRAVERPRHGELQQDPADLRVRRQARRSPPPPLPAELSAGSGRWKSAMPSLRAGPALVPHVDRRARIVADEDRRQSGRAVVLARSSQRRPARPAHGPRPRPPCRR